MKTILKAALSFGHFFSGKSKKEFVNEVTKESRFNALSNVEVGGCFFLICTFIPTNILLKVTFLI